MGSFVYSSVADEMNIIVSMQKMYAWMAEPNQSKYSEIAAGTPTVKNGTPERNSPMTPGSQPNSARFATVSAQ